MIETTEPRWSLALASPLHAASDECLPCEAVALARAMLLQRGALARVEAEQLQAAVARWPGEAPPPRLCARFGIATGLPTPPTFVLPKLPPNLDDAGAESDDEASRQGPAFEEREPSADAEHNEQVDDARLRASGFTLVGEAGGGRWNRPGRPAADTHAIGKKLRWELAC